MTLTSSNPESASVPTNVTIPAGSASVTVPVATFNQNNRCWNSNGDDLSCLCLGLLPAPTPWPLLMSMFRL